MMMKAFSPIRINPWREIAILMVILMEVSWITPWFRSLTPETYAVDALRVLIILTAIVLFSYLLIRIMDYLHLKKSIRQGVMVTLLVISSYVGIKTLVYAHEAISLSELISRPIRSFSDIKVLIPVEFIVIITVMIGFWRGISLAQEHIGPSSVMDHFWLGIFMFVVFDFLITFVTGENPGQFFYLFLFSSLVGVSTARMTVVGMVRGGKENKFNRSWFLGIILAALMVVGLSSLFGGLIADKFAWIGNLLFGLFGSIILLIWVVFSPIISYLIVILGNLFQNSQHMKDLGDSLQKLNDLMRGFGLKISDWVGQSEIGKLISQWGPTIKFIILVSLIVLVVVGIILWIAITLWRDRERRIVADEEKTNIKDGNLLKSLLDMFLLRWNRTLSSLEQLTDLKQRRRIRVAARIRQVYAELMELCESLGQPRPDAQTPLEFVPKLERIFPEFSLEINSITQAYMNVRYGLLPESQDDVTRIEDAWKKLHAAGHALLIERKQKNKKKAYGSKSP